MNSIQLLEEKLSEDPKDYSALKALGQVFLLQRDYREANKYFKDVINVRPHLMNDILIVMENNISEDYRNVELRLALVDLYIAREQYKEAVSELDEILEIDPVQPLALKKLARIFLKFGAYEQIIEQLYLRVDLVIDDEELTGILTSALIESHQVDKALVIYQKLYERSPHNLDVLKTLSDLYVKNQRYAQAADYLMQWLQLDAGAMNDIESKMLYVSTQAPDSVPIKKHLVAVYLQNLKPDFAVDILMKLNPDDAGKSYIEDKLKWIIKEHIHMPEAMIALAKLYVYCERYAEAVFIYQDLAEKNDHFVNQAICGYAAVLAACPNQILAHQLIADAFMKQGETQKALEWYHRLLKVNIEDSLSVMGKCKSILDLDPENIEAQIVLMDAAFTKKDYNDAIKMAIEFLDSRYKRVEVYRLLVSCYGVLEDEDKTRFWFDEGMAEFPYDQELFVLYGNIFDIFLHKHLVQRKKAVIDQESLDTHIEYVKALLNVGDYGATIEHLQSVIRQYTDVMILHYLMGLAFVGQHRLDLAANQFQQCQEAWTSPKQGVYTDMLFYRAGAFVGQGNVKKGLEIYELMLSIDIKHPYANSRLEHYKTMMGYLGGCKWLALVYSDLSKREVAHYWVPNKLEKKNARQYEVSFSQDHNDIAVSYLQKKWLIAAEEELLLAQRLDSTIQAIPNNLFVIYFLKKMVDKLASDQQLDIRELGRYPVFLNNYGFFCMDIGDYTRALTYFDQAIAKAPELVEAYLNRGDCYFLMGDLKHAKLNWQKYYQKGIFPHLIHRRCWSPDIFELHEPSILD